ncbi:MAG: FIMAH domain-containing protein [Candidatus Thorarchaeota archaeon]
MIKKRLRVAVLSAALILVLAIPMTAMASGVPGEPPRIVNTFVFTDNYGPNDVPGFPSETWRFVIGCSIEIDDGSEFTDLTVTAVQTETGEAYSLSYFDLGQIYRGLFLSDTMDYAGQTGTYEITAIDGEGDSATALTHNLDKPKQMPVAENIVFSDLSPTPVITWDPVIIGGDLVMYRVVLQYSPFNHFYMSGFLADSMYEVPEGVLEAGRTVIIRIASWHLDYELEPEPAWQGENRGNAFVIFGEDQSMTQDVIDHVQELIDSEVISKGIGNSLTSRLANAIDRIDQGNYRAATNILNSFIKHVNALIKAGKLPAEDGQELITLAQYVILVLGSS